MRIFIPESMSSFEEFPFKMHEELRVEKGFLNEIYKGKGATTPSKMV